MSQPASTPPTYEGKPFEQLKKAAFEIGSKEGRTPKAWFALALKEIEAARQAERRGSAADMFVAYGRVATAYSYSALHPATKEAKANDPQWAKRMSDFKPTWETARSKAKALKEELKAAEDAAKSSLPASSKLASDSSAARDTPSPALELEPGGSIADRMKALSGRGMDVASSSKRVSHDYGTKPPHVQAIGGPRAAPTVRSSTEFARPALPRPPSATAISRPPSTTPNGVEETATGSSSHSASNGVAGRRSPTKAPAHTQPAPSAHPSSRVAAGAAVPSTAPSSATAKSPAQSTTTLKSPVGSTAPLQSLVTSPANANSSLPSPPPRRNSPSDELGKFEQTFPSLSEFGKQFEMPPPLVPTARASSDASKSPLPQPPTRPPPAVEDLLPELPSLPAFPQLPSVPKDIPGTRLPPPPSRPSPIDDDDDDDARLPSPPKPDFMATMKRVASTPEISNKGLDISPPRDSSPPEPTKHVVKSPVDDPLPPPATIGHDMGRVLSNSSNASGHRSQSSMSGPRPPSSKSGPPPSALTFPTARPSGASAPAPAGAPTFANMPERSKVPEFPITSGITPETLRGYFLNLSIDVLLLDVRPLEEQTNYVGSDYYDRGCHVNVVYIDPTILQRPNLTSPDLEDALSLQPESQQRAFKVRNKYDLVVIYDTKSTRFPRKGEPQTPAGQLLQIISENEFTKPLPRVPALLIGGYQGWQAFVNQRMLKGQEVFRQQQQQQQQQQHYPAREQSRPYNPVQNGSNGHSPLETRPPNNAMRPGSTEQARKNREKAVYQPASYTKDITQNFYGSHPQSMTHSYSGQQVAPQEQQRPGPPAVPARSHRASNSLSYSAVQAPISPPPRASIHPGAGTRRQSGYLDNTQTYSGYTAARPAIDYPQAHSLALVPQPPPAAVGHSLERHDQRALARSTAARPIDSFTSSSGVRYWRDQKLGLTGLRNLGNTCYMNSTVQCLSATWPFTRFFLDGFYKRDINVNNPLGTKGDLADAFAELLRALWGENYHVLSPNTFRRSIINFKKDFAGSDQHDSQEFLSFVMDGLHEDLNRIKQKPKPIEMTPERERQLETLSVPEASDKEWQIYKMRNDSLIVDLFQGQYRNRMECLTCHTTSTTYDPFQWLTLDLPSSKSKVVLPELFDRWVKAEVLDGDEKWNCPKCKVPRRATKTLSLARLPPVLLIQLKRFIPSSNGFWNKSETPVIFPLQNLDLTRYMPHRQPTGAEDLDDPRTQIGPFKYDLYAVSNHMGTLSSGHYTAYVRSSNKWMFCEDSKINPASEADVVSRPAYIMFYKRVPA